MLQISLPRIQRYALILGIVGAVVVFVLRSPQEAASFLIGAAISLMTIHSWGRLAASLAPKTEGDGTGPAQPGGSKPGSPAAAAMFVALRYVLIGGSIYATIKVLGVTPVAMLAGLLVSFLAVVIELLTQSSKSR